MRVEGHIQALIYMWLDRTNGTELQHYVFGLFGEFFGFVLVF